MFKWIGRSKRIENKQTAILRLLKEIKMTQDELKQGLDAVNAKLVKIGSETSTLLERIADLEETIANNPVPQAVADAFAAVKTQADVVDDLNPDAPPTP